MVASSIVKFLNDKKIDINFIDFNTYKIEKSFKYYKTFVQFYQFPKLILSRFKKILSRA